MKTFEKTSGMTLVEVLVTVIVGGILFATIGMLMVQMQVFSARGQKDLEMVADFRFARAIIGRELRRSRDVSIDLGNPDYINLYQIDGSTKTIFVNGSNNLVIGNLPGPVNIKFILADTRNLNFSYISLSPSIPAKYAVEIYIEQEKTVDYSSGFVLNSTNSFIVQLKNKQ